MKSENYEKVMDLVLTYGSLRESAEWNLKEWEDSDRDHFLEKAKARKKESLNVLAEIRALLKEE